LHGCKNLFEYTTVVLKLSESVAYNFIVVSRKAREVPQLKSVIEAGQLSVSKARKITSVLNKTNQSEWLQKAVHMPQKKLEQEVAKVNPRESVPERMKFVSGDRLNLQLGISVKMMYRLKQAQNIESQKKKRAVNLEETFEAVLELYLQRQDPVENAEKLQNRKNLSVARQVDLRDRRQCTYQKQNGERCEERRWLDVHHVIPKSNGGSNSLDNLTTLCSGHHRLIHSH
jgi:5-methylcytosine-specific restriction endonuclease McrA